MRLVVLVSSRPWGFVLLISLLGRVACAAWAIKVVNRWNNQHEDEPDALTLLDEATQLEPVGMMQAKAKHQEVAEK